MTYQDILNHCLSIEESILGYRAEITAVSKEHAKLLILKEFPGWKAHKISLLSYDIELKPYRVYSFYLTPIS